MIKAVTVRRRVESGSTGDERYITKAMTRVNVKHCKFYSNTAERILGSGLLLWEGPH